MEQRQAARHNQYHLTSESHCVARDEIAFEFLTKVIELTEQGYHWSDKYPITAAPMSHHAHMRKPDAITTADLEVLDGKVKLECIADLERELQKYKELINTHLLQAAELKEKKKK